MGLWRDILRLPGMYSSDAEVNIRTPGVNVVITGDPDQVRHLLKVVKTELERTARQASRPGSRLPIPDGSRRIRSSAESQVVRPSELDEMDSPYILPMVVARTTEDTTDGEVAAQRSLSNVAFPSDMVSTAEHRAVAVGDEDEPDPERTAVDADPRGPNRGASLVQKPQLSRPDEQPGARFDASEIHERRVPDPSSGSGDQEPDRN